MTLVNPKPLGYAYGELLPSAHVNSVWAQLPLAIDGRGGSYTLSSPLVIGGSQPMQITAELEAQNDFTASGDIALNGPAIVFGGIDFRSPTSFSTGSNPSFSAPATFSAAVDMTAAATFRGAFTLTTTSSAFLNGPIQFFASTQFQTGSNPTFNVDSTFNKPITFGNGGYLRTRIMRITSVLASISPLNYDGALIESSYATNGPWPVATTGTEQDGRHMIFVSRSSSEVYLSFDADIGVTLTTTPGAPVSGFVRYKRAEFVKIAGVWRLLDGIAP